MEDSSTVTQMDRVASCTAQPIAGSLPRQGDDPRWAVVVETVGHRRRFWIHCSVYLIVNGLLLVVWPSLGSTIGAEFFWPILPLTGWGVGLAVHAVATYRRATPAISETEIRDVLEQLHH